MSEECLINDTKTFEAKEEGLRGGKIQLSVDPRRGIISFGKSGHEYFHQQVGSISVYNVVDVALLRQWCTPPPPPIFCHAAAAEKNERRDSA